ncbi:hypothetical protein FA95DRAFT_1573328 [Auriscalpium vulgare]|uniref:Uncharacterized protein n=1 Tax=Auriscalpium vulgare TaxID=40419 RepID=A0ACB8RRJ5_9AGAM|nr:hypothetical protein FA95DRAFT_1573328 [Auriscalpium vulgare]
MDPVAVDAPVARLPPEILTLIFSILSSIDRPQSKDWAPIRLKHYLGWVTVTHVCQRWRNVALHNPVLWASDIALPSVLGHLWAAEFLIRAQSTPLELSSSSLDYDEIDIDISFILANIARTCAITDLHLNSYNIRHLCMPAPLIHTLNFRILWNEDDRELDPLPDDLFGGAAGLPALRHLSVSAYAEISWTPLLLEQLVSVSIAMYLHMPGAALASMFAALGRMRALERLALRLNVTPEDIHEVPLTLLPALQHFSLGTIVPHASLILARLALPAGVRVHFTATLLMTAHVDELPALFPAMTACVDARATPIVRVEVGLAPVDSEAPMAERLVQVGAWRHGELDGAPALMVRFQGWTHVPRMLGSLPSAHLEALAIGGRVSDAAWLNVLGGAPRLRHVAVKGGAVHPFCDALEHTPGVLSALCALVIDVHAHPLAETVVGDALLRCLAARARAGTLLRELEVVGYDEDQMWARALQAAVPGLAIRWRWEAEPRWDD